MITTILSGLALLVVIADLILTVREKKRGEERNAALDKWKDSARDTILHYIDSEIECVDKRWGQAAGRASAERHCEILEVQKQLKELGRAFTEHLAHENERKVLDSEQKTAFEETISDIQKRLHDLEQGVVPTTAKPLLPRTPWTSSARGCLPF